LIHPNSHYQSIFLEKFLERLHSKKLPQNLKKSLNVESFKDIKVEKGTKNNRKMDIFMDFENANIIIENKINANDQPSQIKDYIMDIHKQHNNKQLTAKQTLFIYLHAAGKDPSKFSLGKTNTRISRFWSIKNNEILDENNKLRAYYLGIDYGWIKEWLESCKKVLEIKAKTNASGESKTRGEKGLNKIIFGIDQYIEILDWYIVDKWEEQNPLLECITSDFKNAQMGLEIYKNNSICDKPLCDKLLQSWDEICKKIVGNFFEHLADKNTTNIDGKSWYIGRTGQNNVGSDIFWFYKSDEKICPIVTFGFRHSNFKELFCD